MDAASSKSLGTREGTSVQTRAAMIAAELRKAIEMGGLKPGARLPSEADLTRRYSVSRTVVREAFSQLRAEALIETRKGSGAYALDPTEARKQPFSALDVDRLSGVIELFELRSAFEIRAAAFAAQRRSGMLVDAILRANAEVAACLDAGESTREADFAFHFAIAKASQNQLFPELLTLIRPGLVPRVELEAGDGPPRTYIPNSRIVEEHERIADAIIAGDPDAAELAMKAHLEGSLERYRAIMRRPDSAKDASRTR